MKKVDVVLMYWLWVGSVISLFFIGFSLDLNLLPDITDVFASTFESLYASIGDALNWENKTYALLSDTTGSYMHILTLLILCLLPAFWGSMVLKDKKDQSIQIVRRILTYILVFVLIIYGFNKVFKWQFYQAEPNTLYTPLGMLSKDIVYWSSMGSSYSYTVFSGIMELLAALLLIFRRTRMLGLLVSTGVFLNIFMINLGFDISVKVLSGLLLLMSCVLLLPYIPILINSSKRDFMANQRDYLIEHSYRMPGKIVILSLFLLEGLYPYVSSGNYNDDLADRPLLHGAYKVDAHIIDGTDYSSSAANEWTWKRVFVHRRHYLIVQHQDDSMEDYQMDVNGNKITLKAANGKVYHLNYDETESGLLLNGMVQNQEIDIMMSKMNWKTLPFLQNEFHFTIDEIASK